MMSLEKGETGFLAGKGYSLQQKTATPQAHSWAVSLVLCILSGGAGFYLGCVVYGTWQAGLETAQVLAGIVRYPAWNPFYIYHVKLWTLVNQIPAVALYAGMSEITLSLILSGVIGMLFFQAMSLMVWALSRNFLLALCTPFLLYLYLTVGYASPFQRYFDSTVYPIFLMGEKHTYGGISLAYVLLTNSLIGAGHLRAGCLLAGLATAVHPSLGILCFGMITIAFFWERKSLYSRRRDILIFGAAGLFLTFVSLAVQFSFWRTIEAPAVSRDVIDAYLRTFAQNNDIHRQPVNLVSWGMLAQVVGALVCVLWLKVKGRVLEVPARLLLRIFLVTSVSSIGLCLLSTIPDRLPMPLLMMMPGRLQNVVLLSLPLLVIGLSGDGMRRSFIYAVPLAGIILSMMIVSVRSISIEADIIPVAACLALVAAVIAESMLPRSLNRRLSGIAPWSVAILAFCAVIYYTAPRFADAGDTWEHKKNHFVDWSNSPGYQYIMRTGSGVMLTSSDMAMQLVTRRPVLMNGGALNQVAYAAEAGPVTERILREIYGVDLFRDDPRERGSALTHECAKELWEMRSAEEWGILARAFGFSTILTYPDWWLKLPGETLDVEPGVGYRLYYVPGVIP